MIKRFFYRKFWKGKYNQNKESIEPKEDTSNFPKDWFVRDCGQDPLHFLWYMIVLNLDDCSVNSDSYRVVKIEEADSFQQAYDICNKMIRNKSWEVIEKDEDE